MNILKVIASLFNKEITELCSPAGHSLGEYSSLYTVENISL